MNCKCNKLYIGLLIGIVLPLVMTYVVFKLRYDGGLPYFDFLEQLINVKVFTVLLSICLVPNFFLFFLAISKERLLAAKGLVIATFIYILLLLAFKFLI